VNIGFYHVVSTTQDSEWGYECAAALIRSAKKRMPTVPIVHFTDLTSRSVKGVDAVRRKPAEPMALLRMRHHAGVEGEWLFVDTDVIFQRSVVKVFDVPFDIGVTTRNWPHVKAAVGFTERMPYNMGVVFSRSPQFWAELYTRLRHLEPAKQQWMGDQEVFCEMATDKESRYQFRHLKGTLYNFPPMLDEDVVDHRALEAEASILHYKGLRRKPLLAQRIRQESRRCA
jgi:hypothetical protein